MLKKGYDCYKLGDVVVEGARGISKGVTGARFAFTAVRSVSSVISIVGVVGDVVAIPIDVIVIMKGVYDLYKSKAINKESNSNKAKEVKLMIDHLQGAIKQMLEIADLTH